MIALATVVAAAIAIAWMISWLSPSASTPEARWSSRTIRLELDGITTNPTATRDGVAIVYADESGWWRHDVTTGKTERLWLPFDSHDISTVEVLPDGRFVVGVTKPLSTELVDSTTRTHQRILDAGQPSLSLDGRMIAAWDADRRLLVHELATNHTRTLFQVPSGVIDSPARWSPDGTLLLWGRAGFDRSPLGRYRTFVTAVGDGATVPLTGISEVLYRNTSTNSYYTPITFLPDGRIAYCRDNPVEVRARPLWGGPETTLAQLDATVSDCMLATRGSGLLVTLGYSQNSVGVMPLQRPTGQPALFRQIAGPVRLRPVAADAHRVLAYSLNEPSPDPKQDIALRGVDLESGALTRLPSCPGEKLVVHRGDELLHVVQQPSDGRDVTQLLAFDTCAVVDEWRFTGVVRFGVPSCTATWCAIATASHDHVSMWRLEHGREPIEIAQVARASSLPTPTPEVAISPDGRDIALAIAEAPSPALYLVDSAGGPPRSLPWADGAIDGIVWDANGRLLISGQGIDGVPYALVSVAADGTRQSIWSSKTTYLGLLATDPARTYLSGLVSTWQQEFLLLDPSTPVGAR